MRENVSRDKVSADRTVSHNTLNSSLSDGMRSYCSSQRSYSAEACLYSFTELSGGLNLVYFRNKDNFLYLTLFTEKRKDLRLKQIKHDERIKLKEDAAPAA